MDRKRLPREPRLLHSRISEDLKLATQAMRLLLSWGKARGFVDANHANEVAKIRRPKHLAKATRAWSDDERNAVLQSAPIEQRVMIALGMFAALREGDACAMLKSGYDGMSIEAIASKNSEPLWIPAQFRLREIVAESADWRRAQLLKKAQRRKVVPIEALTLAVNKWGKAWTDSGFRASFFKLLGKLERTGKLKPGLTFHGLRHTAGKLVIEAGGFRTDVGMLLGDRSEAMAALYSQEHEKKQRVSATIRKLERTERKKMENRAGKNGKP